MREAHTAAMNMEYLWEGRPLPGPPPLGEGTGRLPAGKGLGKPGFPIFFQLRMRPRDARTVWVVSCWLSRMN